MNTDIFLQGELAKEAQEAEFEMEHDRQESLFHSALEQKKARVKKVWNLKRRAGGAWLHRIGRSLRESTKKAKTREKAAQEEEERGENIEGKQSQRKDKSESVSEAMVLEDIEERGEQEDERKYDK